MPGVGERVWENKGRVPRSAQTTNGRITVRRTRWWASGAGSDTPVDRFLDATEATVSVGTREMCCVLGIAGGSFARGAANLKHAAQITLSEEVFRQVVEAEGRLVLTATREEQLELDWSAASCQTTNPAGQVVSRLYGSADGVLVPVTTQSEKEKRRATVQRRRQEKGRRRGVKRPRLGAVQTGADQRYKQMYLTSFYDQAQEHRLVGVTQGDHRALGKLLRREAVRVRLAGAQERVGLADGAVCLRKHLEVLELTAVGLDFFHLSEHVHEAARSTLGPETPAAKAWSGEVLHTVRHVGYEPCWQQLTAWRSQQRGKARKKCADGLLHYVAQREEMIAYPEFEAHGWHIGTGPMEAMCKATTRRIKGPGMRWDLDHAEEMMALEALHQSQLWNRYWNYALLHRN